MPEDENPRGEPDNEQELPALSGTTSGGDVEAVGDEQGIAPGTRIDDFEIIQKVGDGGMGVVYKARELSLPRIVALKVLHDRIARDPAMAKRFRREAILAGNLSHANIVPVFHLDHRPMPRYYTMEFVQGRSLEEKVAEEGYLSPEQAVRIALQACEALEYAHGHNIIHRDVKPANIFLENHIERVRISDFGIAQDMTGRLAPVTQTDGITLRTPAFMSPEQNLGKKLDGRTDIFSLGVTLYMTLTGEMPYKARNSQALALVFKEQTPPAPSHFNSAVDPRLDEIVLKMLAADRDRRYSTAGELVGVFKSYLRDRDASAPAVAAPAGRRPTKRMMSWLGVVIAAAAFALSGVLLWRQFAATPLSETAGSGKATAPGGTGGVKAERPAAKGGQAGTKVTKPPPSPQLPFHLVKILAAVSCSSVDASPDGTKLYARASFGDYDAGYVAFDLHNLTRLREYHLARGHTPWRAMVSADGRHLWTTVYKQGAIEKLDLATGKSAARLPVGQWLLGMGFDRRRGLLYVGENCPGGGARGSLKVVDVAEGAVVGEVPLDGEPGPCICLGPGGREGYVYVLSVGSGKERLYKIRRSDHLVTGMAVVPGVGDAGISLSPDGKWAYVPHPAAGKVHRIDTEDMNKKGSWNLTNCKGFFVSPDGGCAMVTPNSSGPVTLRIFDISAGTVVQHIDIGDVGNKVSGALKWAPYWHWTETFRAVYVPLHADKGGVAVLVDDVPGDNVPPAWRAKARFAASELSTVFRDEFDGESIDQKLWLTGGAKRSPDPDVEAGAGEWGYSHKIVTDDGGRLQMRVHGPPLTGTAGAEAWVRTTRNFNDGKAWLIDLVWNVASAVEGRCGRYHIQITDGRIPEKASQDWPDHPVEGTSDLLAGTSTWGDLADASVLAVRKGTNRPCSICIRADGAACLYDGPMASGRRIGQVRLDRELPWHLRLIIHDASSANRPEGDTRFNLYSLRASVVGRKTTPAPSRRQPSKAAEGHAADARTTACD